MAEHPLQDFRKFLWLAWDALKLPEPTPLQLDFARFVQYGPEPALGPGSSPNDRLIAMGFRGMAKSWITACFAAHQLLLDPQKKILIVSAGKAQASDMTTFLLDLIELMPILHHLKPRADQRRSREAFDVGPSRPAKQPSVKSLGITGQLVGSRADLIIPDDVETSQNAATVTEREKLKSKVREFAAILSPGGRIVYLGTPQTEESIYLDLVERGYYVRKWPARYPSPGVGQHHQDSPGSGEGQPSDDPAHRQGGQGVRKPPASEEGGHSAPDLPAPLGEEVLDGVVAGGHWDVAPALLAALDRTPALAGTPTEPTRFDETTLAAQSLDWGRAGFALQFLLDTSLADSDRYPLRLSDLSVLDLDVKAGPSRLVWGRRPDLELDDLGSVGLHGDRYYRPAAESAEVLPYEGSVLFVDPAGHGKDEVAWSVVAMLHGQLFLLENVGLAGGYEGEVLERIAQSAKAHGVHLVQVESNFGDGMFEALLQPVLHRVYPVTVEGVKASGQKEARICDVLEPVLASHRLAVARRVVEEDARHAAGRGLEPHRALQYQLFHQMTRVTRQRGCLRHDDRLDSLAGAVAYWTDRMHRDVSAEHERSKADAVDRMIEDWLEDVGATPGPSQHRVAIAEHLRLPQRQGRSRPPQRG